VRGGASFGVSVPTGYGYHPFTLSNPVFTAHYTTQQHALVDMSSGNGGVPVTTVGIESSALCANEYHVRFDNQTTPVTAQDIISDALTIGGNISNDNRVPGDEFAYPVAGESGIVNNELVVSPPVPSGVFRIVVRWGATDNEQGGSFSGMIYNPAFAGSGQGSVVGYTRALADTRATPGALSKLCYDMTQIADPARAVGAAASSDRYWWPTGCDPFGYYGTVFVHPIRGLSKTFTQEMTVRTTYSDAAAPQLGTYTFAFFVDAISRPIADFQTSPTLEVDVYSFRRGQNPLYSMYLPEVFRINLADQSTYAGAEYWHAFNLVRSSQTGAYTVQRFGSTGNGAVVSDFQAVVDDLGVNVGGPAVISTVSLGGLGEPCRTGGVCNAGLTCNSGSICR
jgi:hypothetical protein